MPRRRVRGQLSRSSGVTTGQQVLFFGVPMVIDLDNSPRAYSRIGEWHGGFAFPLSCSTQLCVWRWVGFLLLGSREYVVEPSNLNWLTSAKSLPKQ
jgi:hypothetical protein